MRLPPPAASSSSAKPFSLLDCLLQQGPQGPLAAAEAPLLDVPLPQGGSPDAAAAAPSSLRRALQQLAAEGDSLQGAEVVEAAPKGFVGLRSLAPSAEQPAESGGGGSIDRAEALLKRLAAAPAPIQLGERPPAASLPSLLLPPPQPRASPVDLAASPAAPAAAIKRGSTHQLFLLEPPVLPAIAAVRGAALVAGAPTSSSSHLFQPVPVPPAPAIGTAGCLVPDGCQPVSLATLMAQDMIVDDGSGLMLPPFQVEEPGEAESPGGC